MDHFSFPGCYQKVAEHSFNEKFESLPVYTSLSVKHWTQFLSYPEGAKRYIQTHLNKTIISSALENVDLFIPKLDCTLKSPGKLQQPLIPVS